MSLCKFCRAELFEDVSWQPGDWKAFHTSADKWLDSLRQHCGICTILAERIARESSKLTDSPRYGFTQAELMTETEKQRPPLYRVRYHPRNIKGQVFLGFEPAETADIGARSQRQAFIAYTYSSSQVLRDGRRKLNYRRVNGNTTADDTAIKQVKTWIAACDAKHGPCQAPRKARHVDDMPKRLLECGDMVKLVETRPEQYTGPYLTLSHCWPKREEGIRDEFDEVVLTSATKEQLMAGIERRSLPLLFQQAVDFVLSIGQRYLWIDAMCIIQDKASPEKLEEIRKMNQVYGDSYCNIAAVNATDWRTGLFSDRVPNALELLTIDAMWMGYRQQYHVVRQDYWEGRLLSGKLFSRGWVFQERVLAPRIVYFTRDEIFWQCASVAATETYPDGLPPAIQYVPNEECRLRALLSRLGNVVDRPPLDQRTLAVLHSTWKTAAETYSGLNLTKTEDRVAALYGMVKLMERIMSDHCRYGLWKTGVEKQLAWYVSSDITWVPAKQDDIDHVERVAPSWSWLSVLRPIQQQPQVSGGFTTDLEIVTDWSQLSTLPTMDKSNFRLQVKAPLYSLSFRFDPPTSSWTGAVQAQNAVLSLIPDRDMHERLGWSDGDCCTLCCAMLYHSDFESSAFSGKMLAMHSDDSGRSYRRLGLVTFDGFGADAWKALTSLRVEGMAPSGESKFTLV